MKLIYFNLMGRAELARMILAHAKVDYEDERIEFQDWPKIKPTMISGQVPVLEVDGKFLCQSMTIARYLAKKYNLMGSNDWEIAQVDMVSECIFDALNKVGGARYQPHPEAKEMMMEKNKNEVMPQFFSLMEKFLKDSEGDYLVGNEVTYADFGLVTFLTFVQRTTDIDIPSTMLAFKEKVESIPSIQEWIKKRPQTDF